MKGLNKVMLIGNVGKDPEVQFQEGNVVFAKFPLATSETFKDKTGTVQSVTEWHTIVLWRGLAELAHKYVHKGSIVYIEGRIKYKAWDDKDKFKRNSVDIVADNIVLLDKRKEQTEIAVIEAVSNVPELSVGALNLSKEDIML